MKTTTFEARDFREGFKETCHNICNTEGKLNMVVNTMVDYLNAVVDEGQFESRLYRSLVMSMDVRRKYGDVQFNNCTITCNSEQVKRMLTIINKVIAKLHTEYAEFFNENEEE